MRCAGPTEEDCFVNIIQAVKVSYSYRSKYQTIEAVKQVTCGFEPGKMYVITGESGSGKTTLLSLLAGLDLPTEGSIVVDGRDMREINRDRYRRETASVVYQSFHLFPLLTAQENVMYPLELRGVKRHKAADTARGLIAGVGLEERVNRQFPTMMSGGQQQRVAIARALAAGGRILLADEPTGNLDTANEAAVIGLLKMLAHERAYAVIIVTHNRDIVAQADHVYVMQDGALKDGTA